MPQVAAMIEEDYHVTPVLADPDEAVAKGAAIYAGNEKAFNDFVASEAEKSGKTVEEIKEDNLVTGELDQLYVRMGGNVAGDLKINITNVLSRTYGLGIMDGDNRPIIYNMLMINDKLPATRTETFYTISDGQKGIDINIYESRSTEGAMEIEDRQPLTTIEMRFKKRVDRQTPVIMTTALDNSGILHIIAEEQMYHSKLDTTFQLSNQMSETELAHATRRMSIANVE